MAGSHTYNILYKLMLLSLYQNNTSFFFFCSVFPNTFGYLCRSLSSWLLSLEQPVVGVLLFLNTWRITPNELKINDPSVVLLGLYGVLFSASCVLNFLNLANTAYVISLRRVSREGYIQYASRYVTINNIFTL